MAEKVIRYKCKYCKKTFAKKTYAEKHEQICFWNVTSKSCVKCLNLSHIETVNGRLLTEKEKYILKNPVENKHGIIDREEMFSNFYFTDKFEYLNEILPERYCEKLKILLSKKLHTNCCSFDCA